MADYRRIYVERAPGGDTEAQGLLGELRGALGLTALSTLRCLTCYDICGLSSGEIDAAAPGILFEPPSDRLLNHLPPFEASRTLEPSEISDFLIAREYLPGQFDQRSDSAARILRLLHPNREITVSRADIFLFSGRLSQEEIHRIRRRLINPVESREKDLSPSPPAAPPPRPPDIPVLTGFRQLKGPDLDQLKQQHGIVMSAADLQFTARWFADKEGRDPNLAELKILDAYWSDHCRHTTFETEIINIDVDDSPEAPEIHDALAQWEQARQTADRADKPQTLMDLATAPAVEARCRGILSDWDISEEVNACTLKVNALINGRSRPWLLLFKNETHNHPTEIEPRGGASTCIGGAVRDPLSGRAYVHQALRVSGGADPRQAPASALPGKLPQHLIARGAAEGYSDYGNQLGLPCTLVREFYHPGYAAKRLECGAVMGAAPADHVIRRLPAPGDAVILVGGRTGRDGIGGAAGSSSAHRQDSLEKAGAEVQKGNPPEERKLQRLFRRPRAARLIKRCNDFGAGGIAVAIGELADGLLINLDAVPVKYTGLNAMELALSESQERMAAVLNPSDVDDFIRLAEIENLEAVQVAQISPNRRLQMRMNGTLAVDLDRDLLSSNGVRRRASARITAPRTAAPVPPPASPPPVPSNQPAPPSGSTPPFTAAELKDALSSPDAACRLGLEEQFDGTVGGTTVLAPRGGRRGRTPAEASVHLFPAEGQVESTGIMAVGFDPLLTEASPFRGGQYALIDALAAVCAVGADWRAVRFSLQEYFGRTDRGPEAWGRPLAVLLGALTVQRRWGVPAVGGKDSMSGSFENLDVPPTLIAFAAASARLNRIIGAAFPRPGLTVALLRRSPDAQPGSRTSSPPGNHPKTHLPVPAPDFDTLAANWDWVNTLNREGNLSCAARVSRGGWAVKTLIMAFGNGIGLKLTDNPPENPFDPEYGSLIIASALSAAELSAQARDAGAQIQIIGETTARSAFNWSSGELSLHEAEAAWRRTFRTAWPPGDEAEPAPSEPPAPPEPASTAPPEPPAPQEPSDEPPAELPSPPQAPRSIPPIASPRVCIPVFPGTNGEDDAKRAFLRHGAVPRESLFLDRSPQNLHKAVLYLAAQIDKSQILCIPGGFSAGDEPDGAGKYIAAVLRHPEIADALHRLLQRDGLILGICNGFQALIKSGWLIQGAPGIPGPDSPTLIRNRIGRHTARIIRTVSLSSDSPWLAAIPPGSVHSIPISHGEGRLTAPPNQLQRLFEQRRVPFQYCDQSGRPSMAPAHNPNGSAMAVEALLSPCGRILGKMGHSERWRPGTLIDIPGMEIEQPLIAGGVQWFR